MTMRYPSKCDLATVQFTAHSVHIEQWLCITAAPKDVPQARQRQARPYTLAHEMFAMHRAHLELFCCWDGCPGKDGTHQSLGAGSAVLQQAHLPRLGAGLDAPDGSTSAAPICCQPVVLVWVGTALDAWAPALQPSVKGLQGACPQAMHIKPPRAMLHSYCSSAVAPLLAQHSVRLCTAWKSSQVSGCNKQGKVQAAPKSSISCDSPFSSPEPAGRQEGRWGLGLA